MTRTTDIPSVPATVPLEAGKLPERSGLAAFA